MGSWLLHVVQGYSPWGHTEEDAGSNLQRAQFLSWLHFAQLFSLLWACLLIRDAEAPTVGPAHRPHPRAVWGPSDKGLKGLCKL